MKKSTRIYSLMAMTLAILAYLVYRHASSAWFKYDNTIRLGDCISATSVTIASIALFINAWQLHLGTLRKRAEFIVSVFNQYITDVETAKMLEAIRYKSFRLTPDFIGTEPERHLRRLLTLMEKIAVLYKMGTITRTDLELVEDDFFQVRRNGETRRYFEEMRASRLPFNKVPFETFWTVAGELQESTSTVSTSRRPSAFKRIWGSSVGLLDPYKLGLGVLSNDLGLSLGTSNTLVYVRDYGIVLREPSVVAVKAGTNKVLAVGNEAKRMLGRTPAGIVAARPLKDGVIADFEITEAMLRHFITKVHNRAKWVKPRVVIAVPTGLSDDDLHAFVNCGIRAGAREVHLIESPMAAAIGVGLPVQDAAGNMIIDIGGGTTHITLVSLAGIVFSRSLRVGGDEMDEAIVNYVKRAYNLMIGERTAEEIKIKIGSAYPPENVENEMTMEIKGRDLVGGPKTLTMTSQEVREALLEPVNTIVESVRITLERCPPELAADLVDRGLVLAGGGALLRGLDDLLKQETGLRVYVADDPLSAAAEGTGKVLGEIKFLSQVAWRERLQS